MLDHASRIRGRPRMPSASNFDHAAVSQEGGCQLNHLYSGVIHPWGVPTQPKINPEAFYPGRVHVPCHLPLGIQQRRSTAAHTAFSCCIPVYSYHALSRAACRGLQLYSGIQRSTVYSSTAVYSLQQSTFPLRSVGGVVGLYSLTSVHGSNLGVNNVSTAHLSLDISLTADP